MTLGSIPALTISSKVWNALASCPALPQALIRAEYVTRFGCSPRSRMSCSQENASLTYHATRSPKQERDKQEQKGGGGSLAATGEPWSDIFNIVIRSFCFITRTPLGSECTAWSEG